MRNADVSDRYLTGNLQAGGAGRGAGWLAPGLPLSLRLLSLPEEEPKDLRDSLFEDCVTTQLPFPLWDSEKEVGLRSFPCVV